MAKPSIPEKLLSPWGNAVKAAGTKLVSNKLSDVTEYHVFHKQSDLYATVIKANLH